MGFGEAQDVNSPFCHCVLKDGSKSQRIWGVPAAVPPKGVREENRWLHVQSRKECVRTF